MSDGIAAAIGAVAGALATMGSQGWLAWLGRRNASRTAARLLFGDAKEARDIMVQALTAGEWRTRRDFAHVVQSWRLHREAVARAIGTRAFHDVAGAFQAIEFVQLVRERNTRMADEGFAIGHDCMIDALPRMNAARLVLARAGGDLVGAARPLATEGRSRARRRVANGSERAGPSSPLSVGETFEGVYRRRGRMRFGLVEAVRPGRLVFRGGDADRASVRDGL